jgi:hypothetical protein
MKNKTVHTTTGGRVIIGDDLHKYARRWARRWLRRNNYKDYADEWDTYGCFDINLYVEDDIITITAYALVHDDKHNVVADTSDYINLLQLNLKGKNK